MTLTNLSRQCLFRCSRCQFFRIFVRSTSNSPETSDDPNTLLKPLSAYKASNMHQIYQNRYDSFFLIPPKPRPQSRTMSVRDVDRELLKQSYVRYIVLGESMEACELDRLWLLSATEMTFVFEMLASYEPIESSELNHILKNESGDPLKEAEFAKASENTEETYPKLSDRFRFQMANLISHNCFNWLAIKHSTNLKLREKLIKEKPRIGLAFCESNPQGPQNFADWVTRCGLTNDLEKWTVSGVKQSIIPGDYDYYLTYAITKDSDEIRWMLIDSKPSDKIVPLLIPSSKVKIEHIEKPFADYQLDQIRLDNVIVDRQEAELFRPTNFDSAAFNIIGLARLAMSAYIVGHLKGMLDHHYRRLIQDKSPLLTRDSVSKVLVDVTRSLFVLDSCNYLAAQLYDSAESIEGIASHIEATLCWLLTQRLGTKIIQQLHSVFDAGSPINSPMYELLHMFDSLYEPWHNQALTISQLGLRLLSYSDSRVFSKKGVLPIQYHCDFLSVYMKRQKQNARVHFQPFSGFFFKFPMDLMKDAKLLEALITKFSYFSDHIVSKFEQKKPNILYDCNLFVEASLDVYQAVALLMRIGRMEGLAKKEEIPEYIIMHDILQDCARRIDVHLDEIERSCMNTNNMRNHIIHKSNSRYGGYAFTSPLNFYGGEQPIGVVNR